MHDAGGVLSRQFWGGSRQQLQLGAVLLVFFTHPTHVSPPHSPALPRLPPSPLPRPAPQTALCIHNIAFQGRFWPDQFEQLGMPADTMDLFSFTDGNPNVFDEAAPADEGKAPTAALGANFQKVNWLKAGIMACDKLLTVSPNYATGEAARERGG